MVNADFIILCYLYLAVFIPMHDSASFEPSYAKNLLRGLP